MMRKVERSRPNRRGTGNAERTKFRRRVIVTLFVYSILTAAGIFIVGNQHISSMDYLMQNSSLRNQIEELEREKRRLILAREVCQSPNEIKKAAKKAGLFEMDREQLETSRIMAELRTDKAVPKKSENDKFVVKTASVRSVLSSPVSGDKLGKKKDQF